MATPLATPMDAYYFLVSQLSAQGNTWLARWIGTNLGGSAMFVAYRHDGFYVEGSAQSAEAVPTLLGVWNDSETDSVTFTESKEQAPMLYESHQWDNHGAHGVGIVRDYLQQVRPRWPPDEVEQGINRRAYELQTTDPQVLSLFPACEHNASRIGSTTTWGWVDPQQIVLTPNSPHWGEFNYRPERTGQLINRWMKPDDDEAAGFEKTMKNELVVLNRIPGPDGPLYANYQNGNHRVHAARITGLPLMWAAITQPHYSPDALQAMHSQPDWQQAYRRAYPPSASEGRAAGSWGPYQPTGATERIKTQGSGVGDSQPINPFAPPESPPSGKRRWTL